MNDIDWRSWQKKETSNSISDTFDATLLMLITVAFYIVTATIIYLILFLNVAKLHYNGMTIEINVYYSLNYYSIIRGTSRQFTTKST